MSIKMQYTLVYLVIFAVCAVVILHDFSVSGNVNPIFVAILTVSTVIFAIALLRKPKKRTGYIDEE